MASTMTKVFTGLIAAGAITSLVGMFNSSAENTPAPAAVAPNETAQADAPAETTAPVQTAQPSADPAATPATTATAPAAVHFNHANGNDFVLVCMRDTSRDQLSKMSDNDKAKAEAYKNRMIEVAQGLVDQPGEDLAGFFKDGTKLEFDILRYDPSIVNADASKISVIPMNPGVELKCESSGSAIAKIPLPIR